MHYVYLLLSLKDKSTYIGCTDDLRKRFKEHKQGKVKSTKSKLPYKLIYYEAYSDKTDARRREIELKRHSQRKEQLFKQLENTLASSSSG